MKLSKRFKIVIYIASAFHSVWLIVYSFIILNSPITHWDDQEIAWLFHEIKKDLLAIDKKPPQDKFLFIDVSKSNKLIPAFEDGIEIGNHDITDREALAKFFNILKKHPYHEYALCDIRFFDPSPDDSLLAAAFKGAPRVLVSSHQDENGLRKPIFDVDYSASDYDIEGGFFKYRLIFDDTVKTTPVRLFELITGKKIEKSGSYVKVEDQYMCNNFILDFRIRPYHYSENKEDTTLTLVDSAERYKIPTIHLNVFLEAAEVFAIIDNKEFFEENFKDRIIVLGDFSDRDLHGTTIGDVAGPVILIDSYLALLNGDNIIKWDYLLYLWVCYFFISFLMFHPADVVEIGIKRLFPKSTIVQNLLSFVTYVFFILIISLIGYIAFDFQMSIIFLILYVKPMDWFIHMILYRNLLDSKRNSKLKSFILGS